MVCWIFTRISLYPLNVSTSGSSPVLVFVNSRMKEFRVLLDSNITLFLKPEPATREQYTAQRLEIELFEKRV